jgi:hypothetical protein
VETKQIKSILRSSNKRLVIIGRFSSTNTEASASNGITFGGDESNPRIGVAEFFNEIEPELRYERGTTKKVGPTAFNSFKLRAPADADQAGHGQVITPDSPFLADAEEQTHGKPSQAWVGQGGAMLKRLLEDLDQLTFFSDGRFSAGLLNLTRRYMIDYADAANSDKQIDRGDWESLTFSHSLSASIVNYMTCYVTDEPNARTEVAKALSARTEGDDAPLTKQQVDDLLMGLAECRRLMGSRKGPASDGIYQAMQAEDEFHYLKDYAGDSKYGITVSPVGNDNESPGSKDFAGHYRYYLQRSASVHRFVRNGSLHSYLMMWLAGKYTPWNGNLGQLTGVAKRMYQVSVEGQGDKRIPGETKEERKRKFELIRDAESEVSEQERATLKESNVYERLESALKEGIMEKLTPARSFQRSMVNKRNRELFVALAQMAGGKAGQILNQATTQAESLSAVYRAVKNVRAEENQVLQTPAFEKALRGVRSEKLQTFVDGVLGELGGLGVDGEELKTAVCELVVKRIAVETKTFFDRNWLNDMDAIEEEVQQLGELYDLRNKVDVERRSGASRGMPMLTVTQVELQQLVEAGSDELEAYSTDLGLQAAAAGLGSAAAPARVVVPMPEALREQAEKEAIDTVIKGGSGEQIGTLSTDEGGHVTIQYSPDIEPEALLDKANTMSLAGEDVVLFDIAGLDLEPAVAEAQEHRRLATEGTTRNFGSYSTTQALIRQKYEDERAKGDSHFTRGARALALGEFMVATPPAESNLGIADLSNVLGVALDIVEHIAELGNDKVLTGDEQLPDDVLARLNLSVHYPVNNDKELSSILQYHHGQCQDLSKLDTYFSELRSIRQLFESLQGTSAEITIYNCTLADHASDDWEKVPNASDLFVIKQHPVVAYLTAQSRADATSLKTMCSRVLETMNEPTEETKALQLPIVVSPVGIDSAGSIFGIVSPKQSPELSQIVLADSAAAKADDVIPCTKVGLDPYMALAAALVVGGDGTQLGDVPDSTARRTHWKALRVKPEKQSLAKLLRQAWFAHGTNLCANLCMTKWVNLCLLEQPTQQGHLATLVKNNCLSALRETTNSKEAAYLGADLYDALGADTAPGGMEQYLPHVFDEAPEAGKTSRGTPLSAEATRVSLNGGTLGTQKHNFGAMPFIAALSDGLT